ncbi:unnamed protein product, partial [Mesorhabditis spiculigera]
MDWPALPTEIHHGIMHALDDDIKTFWDYACVCKSFWRAAENFSKQWPRVNLKISPAHVETFYSDERFIVESEMLQNMLFSNSVVDTLIISAGRLAIRELKAMKIHFEETDSNALQILNECKPSGKYELVTLGGVDDRKVVDFLYEAAAKVQLLFQYRWNFTTKFLMVKNPRIRADGCRQRLDNIMEYARRMVDEWWNGLRKIEYVELVRIPPISRWPPGIARFTMSVNTAYKQQAKVERPDGKKLSLRYFSRAPPATFGYTFLSEI